MRGYQNNSIDLLYCAKVLALLAVVLSKSVSYTHLTLPTKLEV